MLYHFKPIHDFFIILIDQFLAELYFTPQKYQFDLTDDYVEIVSNSNIIKLYYGQNDNVIIETGVSTINLNKDDDLFTNAVMILIVAKSYIQCENYEKKLVQKK